MIMVDESFEGCFRVCQFLAGPFSFEDPDCPVNQIGGSKTASPRYLVPGLTARMVSDS